MKLAKNAIFSVGSVFIPAIVGIPAIGIIARKLGIELFGLLSIIWAVVGYASILDLGLSRAVTKFTAESDSSDECNNMLTVSVFISFVIGVFAAFLFILSIDLVVKFLALPSNANEEVRLGLKYTAFCFPLLTVVLVIQGAYEGKEEFLKLAVLKSLTGVLITLMPLVFLFFKNSFSMAILGLLFSRVVVFIIFIALSFRCFKIIKYRIFTVTLIKLYHYAKGVALSNLINPLMNFSDRFILAPNVGAAQLGFYSASTEFVSKLILLPVAISRVFFPQYVRLSTLKEGGGSELARFEKKFYLSMLALAAPIILATLIFIEDIIKLWLGESFSQTTPELVLCLMFGFFITCLAQVPFNKLLANNQTTLIGYLHFLELILYIPMLFLMVNLHGVYGAAITWNMRILLDFLILIYLTRSK